MKRIITLIILMLLIKRIAFCQEIEYYEHDEYERDSTGVYILIENPEETKYIVIKKRQSRNYRYSQQCNHSYYLRWSFKLGREWVQSTLCKEQRKIWINIS